jgi:uncharacterized protein
VARFLTGAASYREFPPTIQTHAARATHVFHCLTEPLHTMHTGPEYVFEAFTPRSNDSPRPATVARFRRGFGPVRPEHRCAVLGGGGRRSSHGFTTLTTGNPTSAAHLVTPAEYLIGSDPECDIVVGEPHVSSRHCRLTYDRGGYLLEDLGSTNGTYVNGVRISEVTFVTKGERVTLGRSVPLPWPGTREALKPSPPPPQPQPQSWSEVPPPTGDPAGSNGNGSAEPASGIGPDPRRRAAPPNTGTCEIPPLGGPAHAPGLPTSERAPADDSTAADPPSGEPAAAPAPAVEPRDAPPPPVPVAPLVRSRPAADRPSFVGSRSGLAPWVLPVVLLLALVAGGGIALARGQSPMQVAGTLVIAGVLAHLGSTFVSSIQRAEGGRRQQELSARLLRERFAIANTLRIQREESTFSWKGYRKFVVDRKIVEAHDVCSFYLVPHDNKPVPVFQPGQYLTFRLNVPGNDKPVVRCYSLSCPPNYDAAESARQGNGELSSPDHNRLYYRVTIKRCPPPPDGDIPPGLVSNYFHDHVEVGDILDVQAPKGQFFLDVTQSKPIVLVGGGVGITPMLSMLGAVARRQPDRETWLFYGVRHRGEHALKEEIDEIVAGYGNVRVVYCYSNPTDEDQLGVDYYYRGRVSVDLFRQVLDSTNYNFYLCGPPPMMESIVSGLEAWGVPSSSVFMEAFGPATVKAAPKVPPTDTALPAPTTSTCKVVFGRSGRELTWERSCSSLLEFAERNGIPIESGCRAGSCGTCLVAVKSGKVACTLEHGSEVEGGSCLTCISTPTEGILVLDA